MSAALRPADGARRWVAETAVLAAAGLTLAACAGGPSPAPVTGPVAGRGAEGQPSARYSGYKVGQPYQVRGVWYYPKEQPNYDEIGIASWYGEAFHNHYTADGEVFDMTLPSAAHTTLPLPSIVEVTNLANGRKLMVRVNDRGPFVDGRVIDLSKEAAAQLGFVTAGVTRVRVRYVGRAPDPSGMSARTQVASAPKAAPAAPAAVGLVQLADAGAPTRTTDYDYATAPKRPIPYSQLAQSQSAPVAATSVASAAAAPVSAAAPLATTPLPDVDTLLSAGPPTTGLQSAAAVTYELQAGTFASEDAARRFAADLTGGGLPEVQEVREGQKVSYRVVVHGLAGPTEAAAARNEAMALGAPKALIVRGS
jgi:rare lipoprotein A